jgi:hypothetical protein
VWLQDCLFFLYSPVYCRYVTLHVRKARGVSCTVNRSHFIPLNIRITTLELYTYLQRWRDMLTQNSLSLINSNDRDWRPIPRKMKLSLTVSIESIITNFLEIKATHIYSQNIHGRRGNLPETWVRLTKITTAKHLTLKRTYIAVHIHYNYLPIVFRRLSVPSSQSSCMATGAILIVLPASKGGSRTQPHEMNGPRLSPPPLSLAPHDRL